jgi:hypothetical protein
MTQHNEFDIARERDREDIKNPYANMMREVNRIDPRRIRFTPLKPDDRLLEGTISDLLLRMIVYKQTLARKHSDLKDQLVHEYDHKKRLRLLNSLEDLRVKQTLLDSYYYLQLHNDISPWEGPPFVTIRSHPDGTLVAVISATTEQTYQERATQLFHAIDQRIEKEGLGVLIDDSFEKELRKRMDALNEPYSEP